MQLIYRYWSCLSSRLVILRLKCGGPLMMVIAEDNTTGNDQILTCVWFDHARDRCRNLPEKALSKVANSQAFLINS